MYPLGQYKSDKTSTRFHVFLILGLLEGICGYAQYLSIGREVEGMTLLVEMPAGASFAVYDAAGECVEFSWVSGRNSACLRELRSLLNIQNRMAVVIVGSRTMAKRCCRPSRASIRRKLGGAAVWSSARLGQGEA